MNLSNVWIKIKYLILIFNNKTKRNLKSKTFPLYSLNNKVQLTKVASIQLKTIRLINDII